MPFTEKLIIAGFILGGCILLFALFVGIPALAGSLGWNRGPMRRSDFYRQWFGWGVFSVFLGMLGGMAGNAGTEEKAAWIGPLIVFLFLYLAVWKVSKASGSRLRDMGWPRWTVWFVGLPLFCLLILFWPPNPRRDATQETAA